MGNTNLSFRQSPLDQSKTQQRMVYILWVASVSSDCQTIQSYLKHVEVSHSVGTVGTELVGTFLLAAMAQTCSNQCPDLAVLPIAPMIRVVLRPVGLRWVG